MKYSLSHSISFVISECSGSVKYQFQMILWWIKKITNWHWSVFTFSSLYLPSSVLLSLLRCICPLPVSSLVLASLSLFLSPPPPGFIFPVPVPSLFPTLFPLFVYPLSTLLHFSSSRLLSPASFPLFLFVWSFWSLFIYLSLINSPSPVEYCKRYFCNVCNSYEHFAEFCKHSLCLINNYILIKSRFIKMVLTTINI